MNTLRAYLGTDTALTLWLRDEAGKLDFGAPESLDAVVMYLYPYGCAVKVEEAGIAGVVASDTDGLATFTVTEAYADTNLARGSYRYAVHVEGVQRADGLLEVV